MTERGAILCGSCKQYHGSVADVKACYAQRNQQPQPVAAVPAPGVLPATEKQLDLIRKLCQERISGWTPQGVEHALKRVSVDRKAASAEITRLLNAPRSSAAQGGSSTASSEVSAEQLPAGRYAVHGEKQIRFFAVDRPESGYYAGRVFVDELFGSPGAFRKERRSDAMLLLLVEREGGVAVSRKLFADETEHCYHCGSPLTKPLSRQRGVGPHCFAKYGL